MGIQFFEEQTQQSTVKTLIVADYFDQWARVIVGAQKQQANRKIGYVDFFAGPGRYVDGSESTPVEIVKRALRSDSLRSSLVAIFNDKDQSNVQSLETHLSQIPNYSSLKYAPVIFCSDAGEDLMKSVSDIVQIPSLFFFDPWGYKGLSLDVVNSLIKKWACEVIFFFNYNRVNAGLTNEFVRPHMEAIFGPDRLAELCRNIEGRNPAERETAVVEALCCSIRNSDHKPYVLPFRFRGPRGTRTSHYLIFATKGFKGFELMKNVMTKYSSDHDSGVGSFEYTPTTQKDLFLFGFTRPLDSLSEIITRDFRGQSLTFRSLYEKHSASNRFLEKHYRNVLKELLKAGRISADRFPPLRAGTMPLDAIITFKE